jgi:ankyrin repeat protein
VTLAAVLGLLLFGAVLPDGTTELHMAVEREDVEAARRLLASGADARAANRYGVRPLSLAAENGNAALVKLLLDAGAEVEAALPGGETPLMTASRTGRVDAVKVLLSRGANPNARESTRGQTALMWAAAEGNVATIQALLGAGAQLQARLDSGYTAFLFAVREGRLDAVKALVSAGASPNDSIRPEASAKKQRAAPAAGTSALLLAVLNAHYDLASFLLDAGANPKAAETGWTPLHAITGIRKPGGGDNDPAPRGSGSMTSLDMVRKLVAAGADINARMTKKINVGLTGLNTVGATPYLLAARTADAELMRLLKELGADASIANADGATALIVAAGLGTRSPGEDAGTEDEVIEALGVALEHGADIDAVDRNGETAMHGAAYKNLPAAVQFLADHGARIEVWNKPNKHGWTPLTIAKGYRFGNFKPSAPTVAVFRKLYAAAGIEPQPYTPPPGLYVQ